MLALSANEETNERRCNRKEVADLKDNQKSVQMIMATYHAEFINE